MRQFCDRTSGPSAGTLTRVVGSRVGSSTSYSPCEKLLLITAGVLQSKQLLREEPRPPSSPRQAPDTAASPRRRRPVRLRRPRPVAGELLITPSKRAFWRNGSASLISRIAAIHSDRDARWRPGRPSLPLHRSCRGDREPFGWDRACSWNRTEVRNRRFPSCSAVGRGSIGR